MNQPLKTYKNIIGPGTEEITKGKFDVTGAIGMGFDIMVGIISAQDQEAAQKRLVAKIEKLSQKQKIELEHKLKTLDSQIERMEFFYKTLNVIQHEDALNSLKKEKTTAVIILGASIVFLTIFIAVLKNRKSK